MEKQNPVDLLFKRFTEDWKNYFNRQDERIKNGCLKRNKSWGPGKIDHFPFVEVKYCVSTQSKDYLEDLHFILWQSLIDAIKKKETILKKRIPPEAVVIFSRLIIDTMEENVDEKEKGGVSSGTDQFIRARWFRYMVKVELRYWVKVEEANEVFIEEKVLN